MADYKAVHAVPVILSVLILIVAVCFGLFAILSPDSSIRPFCFAVSIVLGAVAIVKLVDIAYYEDSINRLQKKLAAVKPDSCPDYWVTSYSKCNGVKCTSQFDGRNIDGEEGRVSMTRGTEAQIINLKDYSNMSADDLCNMNKQYPWMQVSNGCSARNRTV